MVEYECQKGYILVGEAKISCTLLQWSSLAPQCKGNPSSLGQNSTKLIEQLWSGSEVILRESILPGRGRVVMSMCLSLSEVHWGLIPNIQEIAPSDSYTAWNLS